MYVLRTTLYCYFLKKDKYLDMAVSLIWYLFICFGNTCVIVFTLTFGKECYVRLE